MAGAEGVVQEVTCACMSRVYVWARGWGSGEWARGVTGLNSTAAYIQGTFWRPFSKFMSVNFPTVVPMGPRAGTRTSRSKPRVARDSPAKRKPKKANLFKKPFPCLN